MRIEKLLCFNDELETIVLFIADESQSRALKFYDELIVKIKQIPLAPLSYRQREKIKSKNVRELIFKGYTIPFLIDIEEDKIIVLGIFNQNIWKVDK